MLIYLIIVKTKFTPPVFPNTIIITHISTDGVIVLLHAPALLATASVYVYSGVALDSALSELRSEGLCIRN